MAPEPWSDASPTGFPEADAALTHIFVVHDVERSTTWYEQVLGARLHRAYGGTSAVLELLGTWLLLVSGAGPTPDKPGVAFSAPTDSSVVSHSVTIRVADCAAVYAELVRRGAAFLTPPVDRGAEVRCFFRDPDGHLLELSEAR